MSMRCDSRHEVPGTAINIKAQIFQGGVRAFPDLDVARCHFISAVTRPLL